jgi:hypothetical protein
MYDRPAKQSRAVQNPQVQLKQSKVDAILRSPGERLDPDVQYAMKIAMGHDFSQVKVHAGPDAAESARSVGAMAFTVGQHVVFGPGQYPPHRGQGWELLRHELAHTIQQPDIESAWNFRHTEPGDRFEAEADRVGRGRGMGWAPVQRSASPMLATQSTPGASRPSAVSYRPVSITIGGSPVGETVTFSYPVDNDKYYIVPLYNVTVDGHDAAGKAVTTIFKALRFGVYYDPDNPVGASKSTGPFIAGRASHQKHTAGFRSDYEVHSADWAEPMAWDLNGGFLIHDGPDFPVDPAKFNPRDLGKASDPASAENNLIASIGCIEIAGDHGFTRFNDLIVSLSGSRLSGAAAMEEIARQRLVKVVYEKASRPRLTLWKPPSPKAAGGAKSP